MTTHRIRVGVGMVLSLGAVQCGGGGADSSSVDLPKTVTVSCGCDTSATFDLRAFISNQLPGATPPGGPWPEPFPLLPQCQFYGDGRSFSTIPAASSRLHDIVNMPSLPPGACNPHAEVTIDPYCDASNRRCLVNGAWVPDAPNTAIPDIGASSPMCSPDGTKLTDIQTVSAGYPYLSPASDWGGAIFDTLSITSFTTDDGGGQVTQHYQVSVGHTSFPDHELVATVCGQSVSLYQFTTGYPGPSALDLGLQNQFAVKSNVELDVVRPTCDGGLACCPAAPCVTPPSQPPLPLCPPPCPGAGCVGG